jgi:hypothetical protein
VLLAKGDAVAYALRASSTIYRCNPAFDLHQPLSPSPLGAFAARRSRHSAAKRLVQKAFSIGVPMLKALSVKALSVYDGTSPTMELAVSAVGRGADALC